MRIENLQFVIGVVALAWVANATAGKVTLGWDAVPGAARYTVYRGTNSGSYVASVGVSNALTVTLTNLPAGTNFFVVTAVSAEGLESEPSNEVRGLAPAAPVLRIGAVIEQSADPLGPWTELTPVVSLDWEAVERQQFFRVRSTIER